MGMTNQEAIDTIKTAIAQVEWDYPMDIAAAFDKAVEALAKQEPMPPRFSVTYDKIFFACDKCGKSLLVVMDNAEVIKCLDNMPKYCPECGQGVKWNG